MTFPYYGRTRRTVLQLPKRSLSLGDEPQPDDCALFSEAHRLEESERAAVLWEIGMNREGRAKRA